MLTTLLLLIASAFAIAIVAVSMSGHNWMEEEVNTPDEREPTSDEITMAATTIACASLCTGGADNVPLLCAALSEPVIVKREHIPEIIVEYEPADEISFNIDNGPIVYEQLADANNAEDWHNFSDHEETVFLHDENPINESY